MALHRRELLSRLGALLMITTLPDARADASSPMLASYYARHMALRDGVAYGWSGQGRPARLRSGVRQVGVGRDDDYALLDDGRLVRWRDDPEQAEVLMAGVAWFAAGHSGWFAADHSGVLWHGSGARPVPQRVAEGVVAGCIGDSADYYIRADGQLYAKGLAHRGQYGDGLLKQTADFVATAADAAAVRAHTGHAIYLRRDGVVLGTGGNRFGPLSRHGLGDKADRWGPVFDGARAIATGSRHSVAIRHDASLWAWGEGFGIEPRRLQGEVLAAAAGDTATLALGADGSLWQWEGGGTPRRLQWP
jgi:alpha-tubulin suppressor-like RCC1 family protein